MSGFTKKEGEIWSLLGRAAGLFSSLEMSHPSHEKDFADAIHNAQRVLGQRILQRDYPENFAIYVKESGNWNQAYVDYSDEDSVTIEWGEGYRQVPNPLREKD